MSKSRILVYTLAPMDDSVPAAEMVGGRLGRKRCARLLAANAWGAMGGARLKRGAS
jgi:hypothetical protein